MLKIEFYLTKLSEYILFLVIIAVQNYCCINAGEFYYKRKTLTIPVQVAVDIVFIDVHPTRSYNRSPLKQCCLCCTYCNRFITIKLTYIFQNSFDVSWCAFLLHFIYNKHMYMINYDSLSCVVLKRRRRRTCVHIFQCDFWFTICINVRRKTYANLYFMKRAKHTV